jgi:hypothetical protein
MLRVRLDAEAHARTLEHIAQVLERDMHRARLADVAVRRGGTAVFARRVGGAEAPNSRMAEPLARGN